MNIQKPDTTAITLKHKSIFLAGSIEMGSAEDWQSKVEQALEHYDVTVFNPRRSNWDASWVQEQSNEHFNNQVNWEMQKLEECDIIFMYFDKNTKSPISLLELGYFLQSEKLIVCCPAGFWRKGNVDIMCTRNNVPLYDDLNIAIGALLTRVKM